MRSLRMTLAGTVTLALLGGLGGVVAAQTDDAMAASAGCDAPLVEPGEYEATYEVGDFSGKYWVVVPEGYGEDAPLPLVMWLASGSGDADMAYAGWRPYLDDVAVLFAVVGRTGGWDVEALLALIDRLEADYCIDQRRIHARGSSSSAYTAGMLACEASERIASFQDGMGFFEPSGCVPERPVPLTAITGKDDRSGVRQSVERWAEWNGCEAEPLIEDLGSGVSRLTYLDCDADVVLFDIEGAGHNFVLHECIGPGVALCRAYAEVDQLDEALAFFEQHPLPKS